MTYWSICVLEKVGLAWNVVHESAQAHQARVSGALRQTAGLQVAVGPIRRWRLGRTAARRICSCKPGSRW